MMQVRRILETALYVNDLAAAEDFYTRVLGLTVFAREPRRHVFFRCEDGMLLLFSADTTRKVTTPGIPPHGARGPGHVAFTMQAREVAAWRDKLRVEGVALESEYHWPNGAVSLYFRDPAGNSLELATAILWGLTDEPEPDA